MEFRRYELMDKVEWNLYKIRYKLENWKEKRIKIWKK